MYVRVWIVVVRHILNELRAALLGLYEAHRYFLVWLKDELFPSKSTVADLEVLKPKHLLQKLQVIEGTDGADVVNGATDAATVAAALLNARKDFRAMHGEAVRTRCVFSVVVDGWPRAG